MVAHKVVYHSSISPTPCGYDVPATTPECPVNTLTQRRAADSARGPPLEQGTDLVIADHGRDHVARMARLALHLERPSIDAAAATVAVPLTPSSKLNPETGCLFHIGFPRLSQRARCSTRAVTQNVQPRRRHCAGVAPICRLNARWNAAVDS
jgi:hypothetical protein